MFSISLEPKLPRDYEAIVENINGNGIIPRDRSIITRQGLSAMITVNFYFDHALDSYFALEDCKRDYEKIKDTPAGIGLHIAEGEEDIRPKLSL
jgi:hypothetical protein